MNMVKVIAVFSTLLVWSLGYHQPITSTRKLTFIIERGSWVDMALTCKLMFNGSLVTDDSDSVSTALRYFELGVWRYEWLDDVWIGLFVADLDGPAYKWDNSCRSHNLATFSSFNTIPTTQELDTDKLCVLKNKTMTMWDFGSCLADQHSGICEQYVGPCTYERDFVSGSCTKGLVRSASIVVSSRQECENYCSSIEPMTIGDGECWAVTYATSADTSNSGACFPSVSVNPFLFDISMQEWYQSTCTQYVLANQLTQVSWKRCFLKPETYVGQIFHNDFTSPFIPNAMCNTTITSTPVNEVTTQNVTETTPSGQETTTALSETPSVMETTTFAETTPNIQETSTIFMETTTSLETTTGFVEAAPPSVHQGITTTLMETTTNTQETTTTLGETLSVLETTTTYTETTQFPQGTTTSVEDTTATVITETTTGVTEKSTSVLQTTTAVVEQTSEMVTTASTTVETTANTSTSESVNEQTTPIGQSIAECVCTCIEKENLTLKEKTLELKKKTAINKQETKAHTRTLQCTTDDRASARGVGMVLGVGLITMVAILVSLGDMITLSIFVISKMKK